MKQVFILSLALLLRGAQSLLHGSGPATSPPGAMHNSALSRTSPLAQRRTSVLSSASPSARRPLAPAVLGLRSSRSVANLIPPEKNII